MPTGMVYLVGAGPGDPDLITRRGLACIRRADAIVYDRLVAPELLDEARPAAVRVYAGKAPGGPPAAQDEICRLLVSLARDGKVVCRLKGGDPFVFGRGGEEALALARAGVPFEIVPGVTSAVAVPACAGIPVTHRGLSGAFTVVTGHSCGEGAAVDWAALARAGGTLVLLMAMSNLDAVLRRLVAGGRAPSTPAAAIQWGTRPRQRVVTGTLADLAEKVRAAALGPPAVVVVGEVVSLAPALTGWSPSARRGGAPSGQAPTPVPVPVEGVP